MYNQVKHSETGVVCVPVVQGLRPVVGFPRLVQHG